MSIKTVSIFLKPRFGSDISQVLINITNWLIRKRVRIYLELKDKSKLEKVFDGVPKNVVFTQNNKELYETDLIITLGGDGTLLGVCRMLGKNAPPLFGINMGKLGFITEFSKHEYFEELENVFKGRIEIVHVDQYQAVIQNKDKVTYKGYFINDAVFTQNEISRIISLSVASGDEAIYDISGDGLIVSSPIGSTAYSLAAGGPIIGPNVKSFVLTPICPHSLNYRPIVVSNNREISVKASRKGDHAKLTLDGQTVLLLGPGDQSIIKKRPGKIIKFIKNPERHFFQTLKEKFTHGRR